jgi:hypothetical protein
MDLIPFHRLLIATAIVFCAGFGAWQLVAYARGGGVSDMLVGLLFAALAGGLGVYLAHLRRVLRLPPPTGGSGARR